MSDAQLLLLKDEIATIMTSQELNKIADNCLAKFSVSDQTRSGIVKVADFRRVLLSVTTSGIGMLNHMVLYYCVVIWLYCIVLYCLLL